MALLVIAAVGLAAGVVHAAEGDPDLPRQHTETITSAAHEYAIDMGGTVDGPSTRDPIGYGAWGQVFEPNRFVRLENIGETPVVNPWVLVNGKHRWRTMEDIVGEIMSALPAGASERERARAVWEFQRHHRFHATTGDAEVDDPVKMLNVYGYTLCGDDAQVIADIWRAAGFKTRRGRPQGHCTTEVFYDGAWHLLDGDENIICLLRDNETIAQEAEIVRDHDLMKRTHTYGILAADSRDRDEFSASLTVYEGDDRSGDWNSHIGHTMDYTLRPGESIEWRWDHREKAHGIWEGQSLLTGWGETAWARHANGYWRYEPNVARRPFREASPDAEGLTTYVTRSPRLHPAASGAPGHIVIPMTAPYVMVGGRVTLKGVRAGDGGIALSFAEVGGQYSLVGEVTEAGPTDLEFDLDERFPTGGPPHYQYLLKLEMAANGAADAVGIDGILIENDLQMAQLALPGLTLGENVIEYSDEQPGERKVRLTHSWVESTKSRAPEAPAKPVYPADDADVGGTRIAFEWAPAEEPDGDDIADYHFQLSDRADMRWVLSPNFDKLNSRTADKGEPKYTLPYDGLLNPDQAYYWRVRARDEHGLWGPWSGIWSFTPRSAGVPLDVALSDGELVWRANPQGRIPATYRVYGSDEEGFSISDAEYAVNTGNQPDKLDPTFPANLVAEVNGTELVVIGPGLDLPNANRGFYRVLAIDENGNRSGPSDYAEAPRPLIYTRPAGALRAGDTYEYRAETIRSIGHLTSRSIEGKGSYNAAFWHEERPAWKLLEAPAWLTVSREGVVSGTAEAGEHELKLQVTIEGKGTTEQAWRLEVRE